MKTIKTIPALWRAAAHYFETHPAPKSPFGDRPAGICRLLDLWQQQGVISRPMQREAQAQLEATFPHDDRTAWWNEVRNSPSIAVIEDVEESPFGWFWPTGNQRGYHQRVVACELLAALAEEAA